MSLQRQLGGGLQNKRWSSESQPRSLSMGRNASASPPGLNVNANANATEEGVPASFVGVFWAPFSEASNQKDANPRKGAAVLNAALAAQLDELDVLASLIAKKAASELAVAKALDDLAFTRDPLPVASISSVVNQYLATQSAAASMHKAHAEKLSNSVVAPLRAFTSKHKRLLDHKFKLIDQHYSVYTKALQDLSTKEREYLNRACGKREYMLLFQAADHARSSLEFHITDFLQYTQDACFSRLLLVKEVVHFIEASQLSLMDAQFLLWNINSPHNNATSPILRSPPMATTTVTAVGGGGGSGSTTPPKRNSGDSQLSTHSNNSTGTANGVNIRRSFSSPYSNFLNPPDPYQTLESIVHALQTGTAHTPTLISISSHHNPTAMAIPTQAFGISLELLHAATGDPIPPFLRKCIACLYEGLMTRRVKSGLEAWIQPQQQQHHQSSISAISSSSGIGLGLGGFSGNGGASNALANGAGNGGNSGGMGDVVAIQFLRGEGNNTCGGIGIHYTRVRRESPTVVAGAVKQFLIELPSSLVPSDVYDTLKLVYDAYETVDMDEDEEIRLKSVSNLLTTIPESHFESLKLFCGLLYKTTQDLTDTNPLLLPLLQSLAPLLLRPRLETLETLQDKLPQKLAYDLIRHFPQIFTDAPASISHDPTSTTPTTSVVALSTSPTDSLSNNNNNSNNSNYHHHEDLESSGFFSPPVTPTLEFSDDDDEFDLFANDPHHNGRRSTDNASILSSSASRRFNDDVVETVGWGLKGLVKTMSGLHMRSGSTAGSANGSVSSASIHDGDGENGSWFGGAGNRRSVPVGSSLGGGGMVGVLGNANRRSVPVGSSFGSLATSPLSQGQQQQWALPSAMARRYEGTSSPKMLGLDDFDDIEESEMEEDFGGDGVKKVVCGWSGCGLNFEGNRQLMTHIAMSHMGHVGGNGVVVIQNQ
ncbi:UNVERIFIED_CONTAM: hypothetical protein HDU68_012324 [Siphonaria sp. JEL0065]|nr:hypothetical protein HDU68_012324 [Siphonaria sp. JEL0065]